LSAFKGFESLIFKEEMRAKVVSVELLPWMLIFVVLNADKGQMKKGKWSK